MMKEKKRRRRRRRRRGSRRRTFAGPFLSKTHPPEARTSGRPAPESLAAFSLAQGLTNQRRQSLALNWETPPRPI